MERLAEEALEDADLDMPATQTWGPERFVRPLSARSGELDFREFIASCRSKCGEHCKHGICSRSIVGVRPWG